MLAREFGAALGHGVVILDESKPDPLSAILMRPGAADAHGYLDDAERMAQHSILLGPDPPPRNWTV